MVRLLTEWERANASLAEELFSESPEEDRCPHLRRDSTGPYCARDLKPGDEIAEERRFICEPVSLQLWCLDRQRYKHCLWYQCEPFKEF